MRHSLSALLFALSVISVADGQTFVTFSAPGSVETRPTGINDSNVTIGNFIIGSAGHGFTRAGDGTIDVFDPPGSAETFPETINDSGVVAGSFLTSHNQTFGFVRNAFGAIISFGVPPNAYTYPMKINLSGQITGYFANALGEHAFEREVDGTLSIFDAGQYVFALGINNAGYIVGTTYSGIDEAFIRTPAGIVKVGTLPPGVATEAVSINNAGNVAGNYTEGSLQSGYIWNPASPIQVFSVNGSAKTSVRAINEGGVIAGNYTDPQSGLNRGYFRTPDGTITLIDCPGYAATEVTGINSAGVLVGVAYSSYRVFVGFIYTPAT